MNGEIARMKVVIGASIGEFRKKMKEIKQVSHSTTSAVNEETSKIKNPFESIKKKWKDAKKDYQIKAGIKVPTEEYKKVEADIKKAEAVLNNYYEKRDKAEAIGVDKESRGWKSLEYDIKNAEEALNRYNAQKEKMQASGTDVERPVSLPKQARNLSKSIFHVAGKTLGGVGSFVSSTIQKGWGGTLKFLGKMKAVLSDVGKTIKRTSGLFGALIKKFASGIPVLRRFTGGVKENGSSFGSGLKNILKYTLGIRSLFVLANKLRGALMEGFKNLAQYSGETNASISTLMSSLTQLKNAFASAFAPILNVVAPVLNTLIQKVISVVNAFGQLTGALTGNATYIRAKKVNQDYAASLSNNASNAKKAKKANEELQRTLMGFDQINKMDSNKSNDSDDGASDIGGLSPGDMFETVGIDSKFKNLAEQIKDAWNNADFTEIGALVGRKLNAALNNIPWDGIKDTANRIAKSLATFLNGFIETTDWGLVGNTIAQGINTAFGFANAFAENFHWGSLGDAIGNGINGALNGIDWELIRTTAFNWGSGVAETLNHAIGSTDWSLVGTTISNGINAAFLYVQAFAAKFNWQSLGISVGNGINGALNGIDWELIRSTVSNVTAGIVNSLNSFISAADWGLAGRSFGQSINTVIDFAYTALHNFNWKQLGTEFSHFINNTVSTIDWKKAGTAVSDGIKGILDFLIKGIEGVEWEQIGTKVADFLAGIDWKGVINRLAEAIGAAAAGLGALLWGIIKDAWNSAVTWWHDKAYDEDGRFIISGLWEGIKEALRNVGAWIKDNIFAPFIDGFKSVFGIHSPSTVMAEFGGFLMEGLLGGIKGLVEDVVGVFTGIRDSIGEVWNSITDTASTAWKGITETVGQAWKGLKTAASETFGNIKDSVTGTWDEVRKNASTMWENITGTIGGFWDTLTTSASTKFEDIKGSVSTAWSVVEEKSGEIWGNVKEKVSSIWDWLTGKSKKDFPEIQKEVEDSFGEVTRTSEKDWTASHKSVTDSLNVMKGESSKGMRQVYKNVESYMTSIYNIITDKFKWAGQKACQEIESWNSSFSRSVDSAVRVFSGMGQKIANSIGNLYNTGRNISQSFANGFSSVHIALPHIFQSGNNRYYYGNGGWLDVPSFGVNWYAKGGFPDAGEMFIANESGPELVGRMGKRNAVANNNQIVEGIKAGVFEAVMDAFEASGIFRQNNSSDKDVTVELTVVADSETIYKVVRKGEKKYKGRYFVTETV